MLKILALSILGLALGSDSFIPITAAETGKTAALLANGSVVARTLKINMAASFITNQLAMVFAVTPGTTTLVDIRCFESPTGATGTFSQIQICDFADPATCIPDVRRFQLSLIEDNGSGVKLIKSRWNITEKFAQCSADDAADGDGTVTITGTRARR